MKVECYIILKSFAYHLSQCHLETFIVHRTTIMPAVIHLAKQRYTVFSTSISCLLIKIIQRNTDVRSGKRRPADELSCTLPLQIRIGEPSLPVTTGSQSRSITVHVVACILQTNQVFSIGASLSIISLPLTPHEARSFKSANQSLVASINFSLEMRQPADTEGK